MANVPPHALKRRQASCEHPRGGRDEQGAALVEFALVVPVFALMLFGIVQFGMLFTGWSSVRNSVQTSARAAAISNVGTDSSCPQVAGAKISLATKEMICSTVDRIGSPVGTTVDSTHPVEVGILVQGGFVTVCAQVEAQPFTGFFPVMHLSSTSNFYIEDFGGPTATSQSPIVIRTDPPPAQYVTIHVNGASQNNTLDYTLNGVPEQLVITNKSGDGSETYKDYDSLLAAIQNGINTPVTASWSANHELVLTAPSGSVLVVTGGDAASVLGFDTQSGPVSDGAIESYNPYNLPSCQP